MNNIPSSFRSSRMQTRQLRNGTISSSPNTFTSRGNFSPNNKPTKSVFSKFPILLGIIALLGIWGYFYTKSTASVEVPASTYKIASGDTISSLNESLKLGISGWRYKMYSKFFAPEGVKIKSGTYKTTEPLPLEKFLTEGLKENQVFENEISITILPGWNIWDIDAYLADKDILPKGEFEKATKDIAKYKSDFTFLNGATSLEGFLMPDTYRIYKNSSADNIISTLLKAFSKKIGDEYLTLDAKKAYETLILASIVEREESSPKNRPVVAGILAKRVQEKIALGADATVCYDYGKTQKECTPSFIGSVITDYAKPYNTRRTLGLPPTPISSVSLSSWEAAKNPEKTAYYYYLHDSNGVIHYATTNAEHNLNKQKYIQ